MATQTIHPSRIHRLNDQAPQKGTYVLYWMQQSQRAEDNHALEYAIEQGNALGLPVVVCFGITDDYPEANLRHYLFMLEGLGETQQTLSKRGILMVIRRGPPQEVAITLGRDAAMIVCDCGYLAHQRAWRRLVADSSACPVVQVETDVVVPVGIASQKAEYAARTIRPRIHRQLKEYLVPLETTPVARSSMALNITGVDIKDKQKLLSGMNIDPSVGAVSRFFRGGTLAAKKRFARFLSNGLARYHQNSNQPQTDDVSHMSPYLHFGQISPLYLAIEVQQQADCSPESKDAYLEELIVRRELACNFVYYTPTYDDYDCIPKWAKKTLAEHRKDKRAPVYSETALENAETHDRYWNAAMREMKYTGFMHNYMRMYWGKKILEWTPSPEEAFGITLGLNNKYFLDGRDPNSYAGVAWLYGVHDRAWAERPIFGKVRYMAASGLERKCDIRAYVRKVDDFVTRASLDI